MAEYGISRARRGAGGKRIAKVAIRKVALGAYGVATEMATLDVISLLESGCVVKTITRPFGRWVRGATVRVVTVDGEKYIRTDAHSIPGDNLGNLPSL
jgi:hypothetical protein